MRKVLPPGIESERVAGDPGAGPHGGFRVLCPVTGRRLLVLVSDGRDWGDVPEPFSDAELEEMRPEHRAHVERVYPKEPLPLPAWEHVSVSSPFGCPTWAEMCWVKGVFWEPHECVVQFHPAESDYVNLHKNCLHLWRVTEGAFPMPPLATV